MRRSTITITDEARAILPSLPDDVAAQQILKNWILEKARTDNPDMMDDIEELGLDDAHRKAINFALDHYKPLGLQVIIYRHNGINVWIGKIGEQIG